MKRDMQQQGARFATRAAGVNPPKRQWRRHYEEASHESDSQSSQPSFRFGTRHFCGSSYCRDLSRIRMPDYVSLLSGTLDSAEQCVPYAFLSAHVDNVRKCVSAGSFHGYVRCMYRAAKARVRV